MFVLHRKKKKTEPNREVLSNLIYERVCFVELFIRCVQVCVFTSQPRAESVVVTIQQSIQDAREDGDVVI